VRFLRVQIRSGVKIAEKNATTVMIKGIAVRKLS
jgi:hypothetical protein